MHHQKIETVIYTLLSRIRAIMFGTKDIKMLSSSKSADRNRVSVPHSTSKLMYGILTKMTLSQTDDHIIKASSRILNGPC